MTPRRPKLTGCRHIAVLSLLASCCFEAADAQVPSVPPASEADAETTVTELTEKIKELEQTAESLRKLVEPTKTRSLVVVSPVPDYSEGMFAPFEVPGTEVAPADDARPLQSQVGPGFRVLNSNEQLSLMVHYESQIEARIWEEEDQLPANNGFFLPRQRIFFTGNITSPIEYEFAINRGLGGINVLNAYLNFHFDDRFEFRIGRAFTPFTYDQFAVSNYWLLTPERSVFTTNLSPNRQFGAMIWGYLLDNHLDYAAGLFNGSRNSFESPDNNVDLVCYVNARPLQRWGQFLNIGTSLAVGNQEQSPVPASFRIAGGSPDANIPGNATVPFLILNPDTREQGQRLLGSVHAAYFRSRLSLIGEWQYGYGHYSNTTLPASVRVPFRGFYASGAYFLTGEEVQRRTRIKPLRSVIPVEEGDCRGWGAWEVATRVAQLRLGDEVFAAGLADPALWSNSVVTTDVGANWYLNEYLKVAMFWQHGYFADLVQFRPGRFQTSTDLFWLRCQLYF